VAEQQKALLEREVLPQIKKTEEFRALSRAAHIEWDDEEDTRPPWDEVAVHQEQESIVTVVERRKSGQNRGSIG
jgi:hypothetical protein